MPKKAGQLTVKELRVVLKEKAPKLKGIYKMKRDELLKSIQEATDAILKVGESTTTLPADLLLKACPNECRHLLRGVSKELFELMPLTDAQKALIACSKVQDADSFLRIADVLFSRLLNNNSQWQKLSSVVKSGTKRFKDEERMAYIAQFKVGDRVKFQTRRQEGRVNMLRYEIGEIINIINKKSGYFLIKPISGSFVGQDIVMCYYYIRPLP